LENKIPIQKIDCTTAKESKILIQKKNERET